MIAAVTFGLIRYSHSIQIVTGRLSSMYSGKVVVVAGGSKGLGLQIAKSFANRDAKIVLLARDQDRLDRAVHGISGETANGYSVDLTDVTSVAQVVADIGEKYGRIDVWVNAVGQSTRTSFAECSVQNYRDLMEQNFFANVNASLAAIDLLAKTGGSLVNIGSLASKTAWPLIAPYVTSKHALAGFAKQISLEGPQNVHYLFVCPGPIQSDEKDRYTNQTSGLPENANRPGAGAPVKAIDPVWLAEKIVGYCEKRKTNLIVPSKSRLLFIVTEMWPNCANWLVRKFSKS